MTVPSAWVCLSPIYHRHSWGQKVGLSLMPGVEAGAGTHLPPSPGLTTWAASGPFRGGWGHGALRLHGKSCPWARGPSIDSSKEALPTGCVRYSCSLCDHQGGSDQVRGQPGRAWPLLAAGEMPPPAHGAAGGGGWGGSWSHCEFRYHPHPPGWPRVPLARRRQVQGQDGEPGDAEGPARPHWRQG